MAKELAFATLPLPPFAVAVAFAFAVPPSGAVEVAVKHYRAGEHEAAHYHKIATELTVIVRGTVRMNGVEHGAGTIICIEPNESTDFTALTGTYSIDVSHSRLGFVACGHLREVGYKFDRWLDVVYMQLVL